VVESTVNQCFSACGARASCGLSLGIVQPVLISYFREGVSGLSCSSWGAESLQNMLTKRAV
jgi:hypothetical protein